MADEVTDANNSVTEETDSQGDDFKPISSQEELDRIIQARVARERNKFADYDELKSRAEQLAAIEEESKTEAERQAERLAELEQENEVLRLEGLRTSVASEKQVPANLLVGSTKEELEASADALIEFRGAQKERLHVPSEGRSPVKSGGTGSQFADFFESRLSN